MAIPPYPQMPNPEKLAPVQKQFPRIREAKERLMAEAENILETYLRNAQLAMDNGNYDVARESLKYLLDHMPKDAEGTKLLGESVDKVKGQLGPQAPQIQIGIALGGIGPKPDLKVIDAKVEVDE